MVASESLAENPWATVPVCLSMVPVHVRIFVLAAYMTEEGKTKVNMFFKSNEMVQVTKVRIKVSGSLCLLNPAASSLFVTVCGLYLLTFFLPAWYWHIIDLELFVTNILRPSQHIKAFSVKRETQSYFSVMFDSTVYSLVQQYIEVPFPFL